MNEAHWHLVVNHLPIVFPIVGLIVMITGLVSKSEAVKRIAYMIFILGALSAIAAMNTGERAEELVKKISGVNENYIEAHEETAETFALMSYILGGLSVLGLWTNFKQKRYANPFLISTLLFTLVVLYFAKETGTSGGEIRHTEIRNEQHIPVFENGDEGYRDDD